MMTINNQDPLAIDAVNAIQTGNVQKLKQLLAENPRLPTAKIKDPKNDCSRTLLHIATDSPGHFPHCAAIITALIDAGADVNAPFTGAHSETPLHWAASNNDIEALDTLLNAGANIDALGGVIGGGTPLTDACAFAQWKAANRLIERGARTTLIDVATLGLIDRVKDYFTNGRTPDLDLINHSFWGACYGGQQQTAEYLLSQGAELDWLPSWGNLTPLDAARHQKADELVEWLRGQGAKSADKLNSG